MQAVMAFTRKTAAQAAASFTTTKGGQATPGGGLSGKTLGGMSRGVSILSSLSEYAGARQQAAGLDQQGRDEAMAGRQEYIQAAQRVNAIDAEYNALVGEQLAATSAMGIDLSSGSVVAARNAAGADADRERRLIRNGADTNAKLRRVRELAFRQGAKNQRFGSTVKLGLDIASAFV
ncbi:hypothetical protein SH203_02838 [Brevundimonas sp. SH203]|uniref:hypothetical protein n=1 Tax=Brevundimonas sp. SH203 TaxID=345167 RepID=UPI0009C488E4|nr:hypothetical protein [Brevundimonas sp. SH203]GAW42422.1 hypothetical protein SH203_02838 [Brevundimonas sp. SH203]